MQKERTLILIKQSFNLLLLKWLQPSFLISFLRAVLSWKQYSITFRTGFLCSASLGTSFPGCLHIYRGGSLRSSSPNKLVRRAMDFALNKIGEYVDNHRSLDQRMKDLKRKLEQLNGLKEDAESIMTIELQPRKKSKAEVQIWFKNVKRINDEVQDLDGRIGESNALTRGFHAEDASRKIKEVEELINQRRQFHGGLVVDNPRWIGQVLSTTSLSGEAVKACIEEIWQCLMDDEVRKIGVWGMGGVGKSSIMKLINNQLLKEAGRFDTVIWITVSKEMCIAKLQEDIASKIGVKFSGDKDETTRAGKLYVTLSQKNRFVMIFDDLWEKVSLEIIGIPEPSVGSKLVLTTRSADVCKQMDCKVIEVKRLTEEEAWKLFSEKVGHAILNNPEVEPYARPIAKRCGEGLVEEMDSVKAELDRGRAIVNRLIKNCLLEVFIERENGRTDLEHAPLPSLSNLRVLKKLDLHQTEIKEIPQGMENLVSLEYLNMDCIYQIPNGILSRLSCLQVLNVGEKLISGEEVGGLKKLKVLEGRFDDWDNLNMYLQGFHDREEPSEYRISVGEFVWDPGEYPLFSRFILFSHAPFSSLNFLEIYGCEYMKKLFSPNCVPLNLQKLRVSECYELEEIIASEVEQEERGMEFRLPQLRELELRDLPQLKRICSVHVLLVCDSLVKIRIQNCVELERMSLNLPRLDNVPPPAPDSISIQIWPQEWWESVEWDAKPHLAPIFVRDRW
ncbi:hypothetical protein V6N13_014231 [Hibiscus sabdariffa]